ncbi:MAG: AAA family ATPase [Candidatus Firestonebacteria bacterium]
MEIRKITTIKAYKSFSDFSWSNFCKNASSQETVLQKFSVVFGENGAGKSAICDIFKSVSQTQDFQNTPPTLAEVEINDGSNNQIYKYKNGNWSSQIDKNAFLFFDIDFVNANVHTHGVRSSNLQQGAHTQKAGQLIIDLDEQANTLKKTVKAKKEELDALEKYCTDILRQKFFDKDQELFKTYEKIDETSQKDTIIKTQDELKQIETALVSLQKLNRQYADIGKLSEVGKFIFDLALPDKKIFIELFGRQIKERAQDKSDVTIKAHFEKHKKFIELAKNEIPTNYQNENCPLCMQPLANASRVIEYYRVVFDQTYEDEKRKFLSNIQSTKNELELFKLALNSLPVKITTVFDALEKIKIDFEIQDIYKLEEKTEWVKKFNDVSIVELDELLVALESLRSIERKQIDVKKIYSAIIKQFEEIKKMVESLDKLVVAKNKNIVDFKRKYSDQSKITNEIQEKNQKQTKLEELVDFLKSGKIKLIKNQNEAITKQKTLLGAVKKAEGERDAYLTSIVPEKIIKHMIATLDKFNLNFIIEPIKSSLHTKDYVFSFKIKDGKDIERTLKDGLSEGERQLLSIAFFFALHENLQNKESIVLIFDDPITSLDSPNLKILAELIHKKTKEFEQVIVFTHHPLFFKYLTKCELSPCKFGVLKNADAFGGSFMFFDPGFNLTAEMQKCNEEINQNAKSGKLKPEEIALKYGQLLRLAIEKFIKNDLLMWDKEKKFDEVTENLKYGKNKIAKLSDDDLDVMTNMYKYCNYSNLLHADKETPSALSELMAHIDKFVKILDRVRV